MANYKEHTMKVLVTGSSGFLGSYVVDRLKKYDYTIKTFRSKETNLINYNETIGLMASYSPDVVIHLAAKVGGIGANMANPGDFCYSNLMMGTNIIEASRVVGVKKFVMVGTVCSYPKFCNVPFNENDLWNGFPEETNAPYGIAKKALYVMLEAYRKQYNLNSTILIPCNLYGPNDNFNPESSHVIPSLIKKLVDAKLAGSNKVTVWGTGNATREFLYVDDAAKAIIDAIHTDTDSYPINIGGAIEITIRELVQKMSSLINYGGHIEWDSSKPDGQPRRFLDISRANTILNWFPETNFDSGLVKTIEWYINSISS